MHLRIAADLGGGGLKETGLDPRGEAKHVDSTHYAGLDSFNGFVLLVHRRGRAGHAVNLVTRKAHYAEPPCMWGTRIPQSDGENHACIVISPLPLTYHVNVLYLDKKSLIRHKTPRFQTVNHKSPRDFRLVLTVPPLPYPAQHPPCDTVHAS